MGYFSNFSINQVKSKNGKLNFSSPNFQIKIDNFNQRIIYDLNKTANRYL